MTIMDTRVNRGSSTTADVKINRNRTKYSIRNFLHDPQELPEKLIHFLTKQKTGIPICTAIISLDFKTLYFTSKAIIKIDADTHFKKDEKTHIVPFEIIKARLSLTIGSSINVQVLSIPLRSNLRFCLIYYDDDFPMDKTINRTDYGDFTMTFATLTSREKQVARLVAMGKTSVQLANELNIAKDTVKNHRKNIRRKLKISTRAGQMKMNEWLRNIHPLI